MNAPLILVVEDEEIHVELLRDILEFQGYRVVAAVGGDALAFAQREQPNLILLDMLMPDMDGVELCRRLRADPRTAAIPIVAVSASRHLMDDPALAVEARIVKPFTVGLLSSTVARLVTPA